MRFRVAGLHGGLSPAPVARLGQEIGHVGALGVRRPLAARAEEGPVLEQVGPVGGQRVARQAALELEVGEEVEQQPLEAGVDFRSAIVATGGHID